MLSKKLFLFSTLTLLVGLLALAPTLSAQDKSLSDVTVEELSAEGPLTEDDIDIFLKYLALSDELVLKLEENPNINPLDEVTKFAKSNNVSTVRMRYLMEKIPYGIVVVTVEEPSKAPKAPVGYMELSESETRLIKDNIGKIRSLIESLDK
jgi:hypothetical protein